VIDRNRPALVLAPMDGITDAAMRELMGRLGAFSYAVTEFLRVSIQPLPQKVFRRDVPELADHARTRSGLPVQVQLLGGDPGHMAVSAVAAIEAGATAIDINFGCPAPTVNRNDGGASLLRYPYRIREIVAAVRAAVPKEIPVSAKLRLGWDDVEAIDENADMAVEGGASWLTVHARTRVQGYQPPVYWPAIGRVRERTGLPVIANGDIWSMDDFRRCQDETGCIHFMIGRGAMANPELPGQIARALGLSHRPVLSSEWHGLFSALADLYPGADKLILMRLKQWMKLAHLHGTFPMFDRLKLATDWREIVDSVRIDADRDAA